MIISRKITKTLVLLLLLIAFTGVVCASDSSVAINNTQDSDSIHASSNTAHTSIEKNIEKKNAAKSVKSKYKEISISNYDSFNSSLNGIGYDSVTLNIKSDFKLRGNASLNKDFRVLVINGNGRTIDGDGKYNFLNVSHECNVYLKNLTITNCRNLYFYSGIITTSSGKLNIQNCTLTKNVAEVGGLILCRGDSTLTLTNSTITYNNINSRNTLQSFNTYVSNSMISNNKARNILSNKLEIDPLIRNSSKWIDLLKSFQGIEHKLSIVNSTFFNNDIRESTVNSDFNSNSNMINCRFLKSNGCVVRNYGNLLIKNCIIDSIYASEANIINNYGQLSITNSKIRNNTVKNGYRTIHNNRNCYLNITQSEISYNEECVMNNGVLNVNNSVFMKNHGDIGGAILNYGEYRTNIFHSTFNSNYAKYGGAIFNKQSDNPVSEPLQDLYGITTLKDSINKTNTNDLNLQNSLKSDDLGVIYLNPTYPGYGSAATGFSMRIINRMAINNTTYSGYVLIDPNGREEWHISEDTTLDNFEFYLSPKLRYCNISNNTFVLNRADIGGSAIFNNNTYTNITDNLFCRNGDKIGDKAILDNGSGIISNNINDNLSQYGSTIVNRQSHTLINTNIFLDRTLNVKVTVNQIKSVIGENITLTANVIDEKGNKVTSGNLAFKINGKTLKQDGNFNTKANTMKISIRDAIATHTLTANQYLRNAKNLTATYSGSSAYKKATSNVVTAQIQKRKAKLTITTTPKTVKQYETIQINIKAIDITKNSKNKTALKNAKIIIKINGVTLKNMKGKILYLKLDKNGQVTYNHTIPGGTGAITSSKTPRAYSITAVLVEENYYPGTRNTTYFSIIRSSTTIKITKAQINKNKTLTIQATLKDYKGQNLKGNNKIIIKINGKTYTDPKTGKTKYWSIKNGEINLSNIKTDKNMTIKEVTIVTGERQAYLEGRNKTKNITCVI